MPSHEKEVYEKITERAIDHGLVLLEEKTQRALDVVVALQTLHPYHVFNLETYSPQNLAQGFEDAGYDQSDKHVVAVLRSHKVFADEELFWDFRDSPDYEPLERLGYMGRCLSPPLFDNLILGVPSFPKSATAALYRLPDHIDIGRL